MRRNQVVAVFMLVAAAVLVVATPANATVVAVKKVPSYNELQLQITGKRRAVDLRVTKSGPKFVLRAKRGVLTASTGCHAQSTKVVTCATRGIAGFVANLGVGSDRIDLSGLAYRFPGGGDPGVTVNGGSGNDTIILKRVLTGPANDPYAVLVDGGPGNDTIIGTPHADTLNGGPGRDRIDAGAGDDYLEATIEPG